jgi:hypothetical protein
MNRKDVVPKDASQTNFVIPEMDDALPGLASDAGSQVNTEFAS